MKRLPLLLLACLLVVSCSFAQQQSDEEAKLYNLIMKYRKTANLPEIPLSPSLTTVASAHAEDLAENDVVKGNCNMHSWSDKGAWTACCYTPDHANSTCMWEKPQELTSYKGYGFEIVSYISSEMTAEVALETWKKSEGHNNVIMNKGIWKEQTWKAIGISIYKNYATVWFGVVEDK